MMSRYVDCIMIRTFAQKDVEDLAEHGQIPVINGLTDDHHPCQGMADALTIREHVRASRGRQARRTSATATTSPTRSPRSAPRPACTSSICTPEDYRPDAAIIARALDDAKETGATVDAHGQRPGRGGQGADVIYTDMFTSMGQEAEHHAASRRWRAIR